MLFLAVADRVAGDEIQRADLVAPITCSVPLAVSCQARPFSISIAAGSTLWLLKWREMTCQPCGGAAVRARSSADRRRASPKAAWSAPGQTTPSGVRSGQIVPFSNGEKRSGPRGSSPPIRTNCAAP